MDDVRLGSVVRNIRIRQRWRQSDLATRAGMPRAAISLVERGHAGSLPLDRLRKLCAALGVGLDVHPRWRGGDLERLLNARHAAMAEAIAASFAHMPEWVIRPEVSFSIYGERGVIDFVAWHALTRSLLLIALKTELVDIGDLRSTTDRRRRLGRPIGRESGWDPRSVGVWVVLPNLSTNLRRIREHATVLRSAFPANDRALRAWLREPRGSIAALTVTTLPPASHARAQNVRRVRQSRGHT